MATAPRAPASPARFHPIRMRLHLTRVTKMEQWGANLYGDPCRECGFDWKLTPEQAVIVVRAAPGSYKARLAGATGRERHPDLSWTAAAYVCHVTDNLRTWAERLAGGYLAADLAVPGYDPDLLSGPATTTRSRWPEPCGRCAGPLPPGPKPRERRSPPAWCCSTPPAAPSEPRT